MLLLSMFVRPKMGYVRGKIGLTGQFDLRQPGNYLQPCTLLEEGGGGQEGEGVILQILCQITQTTK